MALLGVKRVMRVLEQYGGSLEGNKTLATVLKVHVPNPSLHYCSLMRLLFS